MVDHNNPQSRNEEILIATIDGTEYNKLPQSRIEELLLELKEVIEESGGGGTTNYNLLSNRPTVNNILLEGNKTAEDLNLVLAEVGKGLSTNDYSNEEKAKVASLLTSIQSILDGTDIDSFGDVEIALLDKADISDLGTAAAKDSTNAVTSGSTDLVESGAVKDAIDAAVSSAYHHAGTKTVAQLTHDLLIAANEGNVYNITDSGTTTSDFIEGIGKTIDEGSNVGICKVGNVYMFDLLSGFVDTTNFVQKSQTAGLLNNDGTVNDEIEDDVDQLKSGLTNLSEEVNGDATVYPYADVITINDAVPANLADCSVKVEPVQDLHGYDKPWVGGAGKNKLPLVLAEIKTLNTDGTWSENVYTENSVKYTVLLDNDGNVIGVNIDGVAPTATGMILAANQTFDTDCLLSKGGSSGAGVVSLALLNNAGTGVAVEATSTGATVEAGNYGNVRIRVNANITVSNVNIYPMIRLATETDATFAPYTNICPISGHTEAVVTRDGVNIFNPNALETFDVNGEGIIRTGHRFKEVKKYIVNNINNGNIFGRLVKTDLSEYGQYVTILPNTYASFTVTEGYMLYVYYEAVSGMSAENICVKYGDDTTFIAYLGQQYTLALGGTIYGGTVDFKTGVMTVDRAIVDLGTLTWDYASEYTRFISNVVSNMKAEQMYTDDALMCSCFDIDNAPVAGNDKNGTICTYSNQRVYAKCYQYDNAIDFTTAMDGQKLTYKLATPTTIQLTPQQIQLLQGTNTLYASTGQISVTVNGVSGAIGGLTSDKQDKTDYALETTAKTVVGAINEVNNYVNNHLTITANAMAWASDTLTFNVTPDNLSLLHFVASKTNEANTFKEAYFVVRSDTGVVVQKKSEGITLAFDSTTNVLTVTFSGSGYWLYRLTLDATRTG